MVTMSNQKSDESSEKNGQTSHAPIAEKPSRQAGTAQNVIATRHVARQHTDNGGDKWHQPNEALTFALENATGAVPCEWCNRLFVPKRAWGRYCTSVCRQRGFQQRKRAGGQR
jgi:hypothetical protein